VGITACAAASPRADRGGALLRLVLPIAAARMALGAAFPAYPDLSDTVVVFICFKYIVCFFAHPDA
jgi:hypothetical protein